MLAARISSTNRPLRGSLRVRYLLLGVSRAPSLYHLQPTPGDEEGLPSFLYSRPSSCPPCKTGLSSRAHALLMPAAQPPAGTALPAAGARFRTCPPPMQRACCLPPLLFLGHKVPSPPDLRVRGAFNGAGDLRILSLHKRNCPDLFHKPWGYCGATQQRKGKRYRETP